MAREIDFANPSGPENRCCESQPQDIQAGQIWSLQELGTIQNLQQNLEQFDFSNLAQFIVSKLTTELETIFRIFIHFFVFFKENLQKNLEQFDF